MVLTVRCERMVCHGGRLAVVLLVHWLQQWRVVAVLGVGDLWNVRATFLIYLEMKEHKLLKEYYANVVQVLSRMNHIPNETVQCKY